jgi:uncharacterized protein YqjF (DUF2071 family)
MTFLSAHWKDLIFINYKVAVENLLPYLPAHTEPDDFNGQHYVSVVAFKFHDTRIRGFRIPFHVNFHEINLRFYVKRMVNNRIRRGVVFVREIVPKSAITFIANLLYKENYVTRSIDYSDEVHNGHSMFSYCWKEHKNTQSLMVSSTASYKAVCPDSMEEFITEHYYGYSKYSERDTIEYRVEHPSWKVQDAADHGIRIDFELVYGADWGFLNDAHPDTVFIAEGSPVNIYHKRILRTGSVLIPAGSHFPEHINS